MNYTLWAIAYYEVKSPNKYDSGNKIDRGKARKNFMNTDNLDCEIALQAMKKALNQQNTEGVEFLKSKGVQPLAASKKKRPVH